MLQARSPRRSAASLPFAFKGTVLTSGFYEGRLVASFA
jgi:hypothetical protein